MMGMKYEKLISERFPYPSFRLYQLEAINSVLTAFLDNGRRYYILEGPVGSGKTVIAQTVASFFPKVYFVTTQKLLQHQFVEEFNNPEYKVIYAADNYECIFAGYNCDNGGCRHSTYNKDKCNYRIAKSLALNASIVVTNYAYLLEERNCGNLSQFTECDLLILDEAHNLESELRKFLSVVISNKELSKLELGIPDFNYDPKSLTVESIADYVRRAFTIINGWIESPSTQKKLQKICDQEPSKRTKRSNAFLFRHNSAWSTRKMFERFLQYYKVVEYVIEDVKSNPNIVMGKEDVEIILQPIEVRNFAEEVLYSVGKKVLLMSGTILSPRLFSKTCGIDTKLSEFNSLPSTFPEEVRPIYLRPVCKMSGGKIHENIELISGSVIDILNENPNTKGIVHAPSYEVAKNIFERDTTGRLLYHDRDNVNSKLNEFMMDRTNKVLISPRLYEGHDFSGDLSRFQIIVKIPWLSLSDEVVRVKSERDFEWYRWLTCIKLIQASGRSTRGQDDYSRTYILDGDIMRFLQQNSVFIPKYFMAAIR
jgi:ATP-dependent DNA helicase DinG